MRYSSLDYVKIECLMGLHQPVPISYGLSIGDLDKFDSILTRKSDINQNHDFKFFIMVSVEGKIGERTPILITEEEARKFLSGNL